MKCIHTWLKGHFKYIYVYYTTALIFIETLRRTLRSICWICVKLKKTLNKEIAPTGII